MTWIASTIEGYSLGFATLSYPCWWRLGGVSRDGEGGRTSRIEGAWKDSSRWGAGWASLDRGAGKEIEMAKVHAEFIV